MEHMRIQSVCAIVTLALSFLPVTYANVYKDRISPNWSPDGSSMWYCNNLPKGEREFILIDLKEGLRKQAFDHDKLATTLQKENGGKILRRLLLTSKNVIQIIRLHQKVRSSRLHLIYSN